MPKLTQRIEKAYSFDDVLLRPLPSRLKSRKDVDVSTHLGPFKLDVPIISSPMSTVTEYRMAEAMHYAGGLGVLHRYVRDPSKVVAWIRRLKEIGAVAIPSVGLTDRGYMDGWSWDRAVSAFLDAGADGISIDVAHAHTDRTMAAVKTLKEEFDCPFVMVGCVSGGLAALHLSRAGADALRVGIGPGSRCTTRLVTGHGHPQLSAIDQVASSLDVNSSDCKVIADGGIRNTGDMVKALAVGAHAVMVGRLVAGSPESAAPVSSDGQRKMYQGMSSVEARRDFYSQEKSSSENTQGDLFEGFSDPNVVSVAEGESHPVPKTKSVSCLMREFKVALQTGFSYSGAKDLETLQRVASLVEVTPNVLAENGVRK